MCWWVISPLCNFCSIWAVVVKIGPLVDNLQFQSIYMYCRTRDVENLKRRMLLPPVAAGEQPAPAQVRHSCFLLINCSPASSFLQIIYLTTLSEYWSYFLPIYSRPRPILRLLPEKVQSIAISLFVCPVAHLRNHSTELRIKFLAHVAYCVPVARSFFDGVAIR